MTNEYDVDDFKDMFSSYCRKQINLGNCDDNDCEFCCVNDAWNKIFDDYE